MNFTIKIIWILLLICTKIQAQKLPEIKKSVLHYSNIFEYPGQNDFIYYYKEYFDEDANPILKLYFLDNKLKENKFENVKIHGCEIYKNEVDVNKRIVKRWVFFLEECKDLPGNLNFSDIQDKLFSIDNFVYDTNRMQKISEQITFYPQGSSYYDSHLKEPLSKYYQELRKVGALDRYLWNDSIRRKSIYHFNIKGKIQKENFFRNECNIKSGKRIDSLNKFVAGYNFICEDSYSTTYWNYIFDSLNYLIYYDRSISSSDSSIYSYNIYYGYNLMDTLEKNMIDTNFVLKEKTIDYIDTKDTTIKPNELIGVNVEFNDSANNRIFKYRFYSKGPLKIATKQQADSLININNYEKIFNSIHESELFKKESQSSDYLLLRVYVTVNDYDNNGNLIKVQEGYYSP